MPGCWPLLPLSFPVLVEALEFPLRKNSLFCSCGQQQGSNQEMLLKGLGGLGCEGCVGVIDHLPETVPEVHTAPGPASYSG